MGLVLAVACGGSDVAVVGDTSSSGSSDVASTTIATESPSSADVTSGIANTTSDDDSTGTATSSDASTDVDSTTVSATDVSTTTTTNDTGSGTTGSSGGTAVDTATTTDEGTSSRAGESTTTSGSGSSSTSGGESTDVGVTIGDQEAGYCGLVTSVGGEWGSEGDTGAAGLCGNGVLDAGEVCDDANQIGGDGCEADCTSSDDVEPIWTLELGGPDGYVDCGSGVAFDCAGNLIVAAYTEPDVIWIRKYDPEYVEQWTVTYPSIPGGVCPMVRVATDLDGNVGFVGEVEVGGPSDTDLIFGMIGADGSEIWTDTVGGGAMYNDYAGDVTFDIDGSLVVTGGITVSGAFASLWVAKYDPLGGLIWSDDSEGMTQGRGVSIDDAGAVLVAGNVYDGNGQDIFVRKYDPDGVEVWTDIVAGAANSYDFGRGVVGDGATALVTGILRDVAMDGNVWLRRYQADGQVAWTQTYNGTGAGDDEAFDMDLATDGSILVAGAVYEMSTFRYWVARVAGDGTLVWSRRNDLAGSWQAVAAAPDGRVAVAGASPYPFPFDWEARFAVYPP